jgi:type II secretory ATPase GspE/PulE/Tfp pilus assembly ATPase PilB-like protein
MTTTTETQPPAAGATLAGPAIDIETATPESVVAQFVAHAVGAGASDLFFAAHAGHIAVQMRHLGILRSIGALPPDLGRRSLAHIKAGAGIDTAEKRRPQDGRWKIDLNAAGRPVKRGAGEPGEAVFPIDLRINFIPTIYGEDVALRLLRRDDRLGGLESLGMTDEQLSAYSAMIESPSGLILITGPTGSGKTSTLYSSLLRIQNTVGGTRKINTIEDPVEYALEGLRQSQVNPLINLGFADLLRSILRQSPDVIMIGEVRDPETAETAIRAANSGVLVFATLHAPSAPAAVQSMRSLGGHPYFLASSLRGVVAQRLVRTLCPECRTSFDLSDAPHTFDEVRPLLRPGEGNKLFAASGCRSCGMSGYAGRTGLFEVMPIVSSLREMIAEGRSAREIREKAVAQGMVEFRQAALLKVARGETSTEEVFRVIPTENLLLDG